MFKCEVSGELSEPNEKPEFVTIKKRKKEYYGIRPRKKSKGRFQRNQRRSGPPQVEKLGEGWEIVQELRVRKVTLERLEAEGKEIKSEWC